MIFAEKKGNWPFNGLNADSLTRISANAAFAPEVTKESLSRTLVAATTSALRNEPYIRYTQTTDDVVNERIARPIPAPVLTRTTGTVFAALPAPAPTPQPPRTSGVVTVFQTPAPVREVTMPIMQRETVYVPPPAPAYVPVAAQMPTSAPQQMNVGPTSGGQNVVAPAPQFKPGTEETAKPWFKKPGVYLSLGALAAAVALGIVVTRK